MGRYRHKIDPEVMNTVRVSAEEPCRVILYAKEYDKVKPVLYDMGVKVSAEIPLINGYAVEFPAHLLDKLAGHRRVRYIAADMDVRAQMPVSRIAAFRDIVSGKASPYDDNGHGSFVAGVAAGSGYASSGIYKGIAPEASIVSVKVMDSQGNGRSSDVLSALQWVSENFKKYNIKVVSLSLGSAASDLHRDDAMVRGAEALWSRGITVVVAAGNEGPDPRTITVPGTSPVLLTVGSVDDRRTVTTSDDVIPDFSSRGPVMNRVKPDVVAPGVNIISVNADTSYNPGGKAGKLSKNYTVMSGTSVSTPLVAGMAALLYQQHPGWLPDMVKHEIMTRASKLTGVKNAEGMGIVQMAEL
jgi:serine protease AprX